MVTKIALPLFALAFFALMIGVGVDKAQAADGVGTYGAAPGLIAGQSLTPWGTTVTTITPWSNCTYFQPQYYYATYLPCGGYGYGGGCGYGGFGGYGGYGYGGYGGCGYGYGMPYYGGFGGCGSCWR